MIADELLALGQHRDVPKDRKLDLSTLKIEAKGCALKGPALHDAVAAALTELFAV
jgi:hypothetical protein